MIQCERLTLTPITVEDVTDRYVHWLSDPLVNRFFETRKQTAEQIKAYILERKPNELWAMRLNGVHIGNIRLSKPYDRHPLGDISIFIGEAEHRGKGLATDAINGICKAGRLWGFKKIMASMYHGHWASMGAFKKAGFELEGIRRKHRLFEGKMTDLYEMGLCLSE